MEESVKYLLGEDKLPEAWYNLAADLPVPLAPPLHPGTGQPVGPDMLAALQRYLACRQVPGLTRAQRVQSAGAVRSSSLGQRILAGIGSLKGKWFGGG